MWCFLLPSTFLSASWMCLLVFTDLQRCLKTQSYSVSSVLKHRQQTKSTMVPMVPMHNAALKSKGQRQVITSVSIFWHANSEASGIHGTNLAWPFDQSSKVKTRPKQVAHQGSVSLRMCQSAVQGAEVENGERSSIKVPKSLSVLAVFNTNSGNS